MFSAVVEEGAWVPNPFQDPSILEETEWFSQDQ